jgi:hypothetical protein
MNSELGFVNVTRESLETFITKANKRIVFAKPAFYNWEIDLILKLQKEKNILCELYFEPSDEAIRFGFGEEDALKEIKKNVSNISIQIVNRIRLAFLIVDDEALLFSPRIAYIDDENLKSDFPNGIYGGNKLTIQIIKFLTTKGINDQLSIDIVTDLFDKPVFEIKQKEKVESQIKETLSKLEETPPVNPKNLKKVYFYRNNFKLLKYELQGTKIQSKKLNLNPFIRLLEGQNERLKSSWTIFSKEELEGLKDMNLFEKEVKEITNKYIVDMGRFGYLIPIDKKKEFDSEIKKIKDAFKTYIKSEAKEDNIFIQKSKGRPNIKAILASSKKELIYYLLSTSERYSQKIINQNRHLFNMVTDEKMTEQEAFRMIIEEFVDNKLKFPLEQEIIDRINIRIDYYDISDELLYENDDFQELLKRENLLEENLRENSEGMELQFS